MADKLLDEMREGFFVERKFQDRTYTIDRARFEQLKQEVRDARHEGDEAKQREAAAAYIPYAGHLYFCRSAQHSRELGKSPIQRRRHRAPLTLDQKIGAILRYVINATRVENKLKARKKSHLEQLQAMAGAGRSIENGTSLVPTVFELTHIDAAIGKVEKALRLLGHPRARQSARHARYAYKARRALREREASQQASIQDTIQEIEKQDRFIEDTRRELLELEKQIIIRLLESVLQRKQSLHLGTLDKQLIIGSLKSALLQQQRLQQRIIDYAVKDAYNAIAKSKQLHEVAYNTINRTKWQHKQNQARTIRSTLKDGYDALLRARQLLRVACRLGIPAPWQRYRQQQARTIDCALRDGYAAITRAVGLRQIVRGMLFDRRRVTQAAKHSCAEAELLRMKAWHELNRIKAALGLLPPKRVPRLEYGLRRNAVASGPSAEQAKNSASAAPPSPPSGLRGFGSSGKMVRSVLASLNI